MDKMRRFWVGADPGGKSAFGLAFVDVSGAVRCKTVSSVDEAVNTVTAMGKPLGLGIDAPMWWSAGEGGGRKADARLRARYGISSGTVQSGNSLRGAGLIGGALLALGLDETRFAARFGIEARWRNEHERDDAIAAVCTREGFEGRWSQLTPRLRVVFPAHAGMQQGRPPTKAHLAHVTKYHTPMTTRPPRTWRVGDQALVHRERVTFLGYIDHGGSEPFHEEHESVVQWYGTRFKPEGIDDRWVRLGLEMMAGRRRGPLMRHRGRPRRPG